MSLVTDVGEERLVRQGIAGGGFSSAGEAVSWLGALQAQDYPGAKWSIGLRVTGATDATVEAAIAAGEIVRTWPLRGTLHFVAAADVRWMLQLLAGRPVAGAAARRKQLNLDDATTMRAADIFTRALEGGRSLTRAEMMEALDRGGVPSGGQRGYHLLWEVAHRGVICFGPVRGKQQTFVLLDEWVPRGPEITREESLAELARRYFTSHGPATATDFSGWAGLTVGDARTGIALADETLVQREVAGKKVWTGQQAGVEDRSGSDAYLLSGFDEFVLGYKARDDILDRRFAERVCPGGNGMFCPTLVVGGRVAGTWKREVSRRRAIVRITPFAGALPARPSLAAAVDRYSAFLGIPVDVEWEDEVQ